MLFGRDPCAKKGHDWQYYGWSVCGFGPYRYHHKCSRCDAVIEVPAEEVELEEEDELRSD